MLLVTGGAGFIGSSVVAALNDAGRSDVVVCDLLGSGGKWRNLAKRQLVDIVPPAELLDWCTANSVPFIYASSAATYGDGAQGFADDASPAALRQLRPMNLYGWSKHLFDMAVIDRVARGEKLPPQWVGLIYINVFGPNE